MGTSESRCGGGRQRQPPAHSAQRGRARAAAAAASALAQPVPAGRQGAAGQRGLAAPRRLRQTRRCYTRPAGKDTQTLNSRRAHTNAAATTALAAADGPRWPRQTKSNGKHVIRNLPGLAVVLQRIAHLAGAGKVGNQARRRRGAAAAHGRPQCRRPPHSRLRRRGRLKSDLLRQLPRRRWRRCCCRCVAGVPPRGVHVIDFHVVFSRRRRCGRRGAGQRGGGRLAQLRRDLAALLLLLLLCLQVIQQAVETSLAVQCNLHST